MDPGHGGSSFWRSLLDKTSLEKLKKVQLNFLMPLALYSSTDLSSHFVVSGLFLAAAYRFINNHPGTNPRRCWKNLVDQVTEPFRFSKSFLIHLETVSQYYIIINHISFSLIFRLESLIVLSIYGIWNMGLRRETSCCWSITTGRVHLKGVCQR